MTNDALVIHTSKHQQNKYIICDYSYIRQKSQNSKIPPEYCDAQLISDESLSSSMVVNSALECPPLVKASGNDEVRLS